MASLDCRIMACLKEKECRLSVRKLRRALPNRHRCVSRNYSNGTTHFHQEP
jgi:hypothetical protein